MLRILLSSSFNYVLDLWWCHAEVVPNEKNRSLRYARRSELLGTLHFFGLSSSSRNLRDVDKETLSKVLGKALFSGQSRNPCSVLSFEKRK